MLKKILNVLRKNLVIIICMLIFILFCMFIKENYMDVVTEIDTSIQTFFNTKMINKSVTELMKNITILGDTISILFIFILTIVLFRNKIITIIMSLDLAFIGAFSMGMKLFFKRPRPIFSLIETPLSFSFPSGHTWFAVGFYGLIIYYIWRTNMNKLFKYLLTFIISMIIIFIGISRLYLGVHYFSDVIAGLFLGILTIIFFIGVYLNYEWKWKK